VTSAVVDTNVLISAAVFGGLPRLLLERARSRAFMLITSPWLIEEFTKKLRTKFKVSASEAMLAGELVKDFALVVTPEMNLEVIAKDPDDNHVLECAVAGNADFIVTGDKHLLDFGSFEGIQVLTARQFLHFLELREVPR